MLRTSATRLRGSLLCPDPARPGFRLLEDGVIDVDDAGRIVAVTAAAPSEATPITHPGALLLPGFVDAHVHYPQTRILGSASGPLLDWLAAAVFPEEARFAAQAHAEAVAVEFCAAMIRQGTTCAAIFSSPHPAATDALFAELDRRGLRALAGLTLMDRGAPPENLLAAGPALAAAEALCERWHGHDRDRLRFCVTPRFALSCTPALLRGAADLARARGLWVQTHLAENHAELAATAAAFPGVRDYLAVYDDHGLCGERSLFAHCIHLEGDAWERLAARGAAVAHCPDSNFFLGSGAMRLRSASERGLRVGLGTDVGAGRTFSLRRVAARAYDAALLREAPIDAGEALWRATRGGALALGLADTCGALEPGLDADLAVIERPPAGDLRRLLDAIVFGLDAGPVIAAYVRGQRIDRGA